MGGQGNSSAFGDRPTQQAAVQSFLKNYDKVSSVSAMTASSLWGWGVVGVVRSGGVCGPLMGCGVGVVVGLKLSQWKSQWIMPLRGSECVLCSLLIDLFFSVCL